MTIVIKRFLRGSSGTVADGQQTFDQQQLSIGSSSDRDILIEWPGVQLRHATLQLTNERQLLVESHNQIGVMVDGQAQQRALIQAGQRFSIGNHEFAYSVEEGNAVITLTVNEQQTPPSGFAPKTRLAHLGVSKRRWSWGLVAAITFLFLLAPLVNRAIQDATGSDAVSYILPSDSSWNTGSFHPAHQFFADDCSSCHNSAFTQVTDDTCMSCHQAVALHYEPTAANDDELACQKCHKEHNGSTELVMDNETLCVDCHQDIVSFTNGETEQVNVDDWENSHPQITLRQPQWDAVAQRWNLIQQPANQPLPEQSGIEFPHDIHLDPAGFEQANGETRVLGCADCHTPEPGGALMQPINMEQHCESCHRLDFDFARPELTVRHGDIAATLRDIAGLKGLDALLPELEAKANQQQATAPAVSQLKLPGKDAKSANYSEQVTTLAGIAQELIEKRGCATCHTVTKDRQALKQGRLLEAWTVAPVLLNNRWIDDANFDHSGHTSIDCNSCHIGIEHSDSASDVHIPARDNCLQCHGNPGHDGLSETHCVDCHNYHLPEHGWEQSSESN